MRRFSLYAMALLYLAAGINHFVNPSFYEKIMPPYLSYHSALIFISGVCEVLFAILLLPPQTRSRAAWLIILMLIAIFPANIQMAIDFYKQESSYLWAAVLRLPLQFILIWWAHTFTKKKA